MNIAIVEPCPPHQWSFAPTVVYYQCMKCGERRDFGHPQYGEAEREYNAPVRTLTEEKEPDYYDCGNCYGNGCPACGNTGRVESRQHREDREDYEDRKADAIRKGEW